MRVSLLKARLIQTPIMTLAKDKSRNSGHQLAGLFQVQAYPTILFLDEQTNVLAPVKGFMNAQQLELYLKLFATNDYKNVKTAEQWTTYQKNFKTTFK